MFQCKRVYQAAEKNDGYRVLVDRLWPRGIKKTELVLDNWPKNLAPSAELRKQFHAQVIDFNAFSQQYLDELNQRDNTDWQPLVTASQQGMVTLLYGSHDTQHNHATVLQQFLESKSR